MNPIAPEHFTQALKTLLDETFDSVHGYYLDRGTSLFETLATITADEASIPVGGQCATLAAQVKHVAFYLDVVDKSVRDPNYPRVDWGKIWRTVSRVTPTEWEAFKAELRANYQQILQLIDDVSAWGEDELGGAMAIAIHTAYHLGEIRQALCTLKATTSAIRTNRSMPEATIIPELAYEDVAAAAAWLCRAFGFTERLRIGSHRVQLSFGQGSLVVTKANESTLPHVAGQDGLTHAMMVRVDNIDQHYEYAVQQGVAIIQPPADYPYGERQYSAKDLSDRVWTFSQTIADIDPTSWGGKPSNTS